MNNSVRVSLIAAMDCNRYIGLNGDMPWGKSMKADLRRFKQLTTGKAVVMGRKTYESIGRPLPDRLNIVMTRNAKYDPPELRVPLKMPVGPFKKRWCQERGTLDTHQDIEEVPYQTASLSATQAVTTASLFGYDEVFVIGGAQIYQEFLPYADRIYLTNIHGYFQGDTSFPSITGNWVVEGRRYEKDEDNPYSYTFKTYTRQ